LRVPLFDQLAPWANQWCTTGITAQGPISHYVGGLAAVLGHHDEADIYFALAASMSARAIAKCLGARTDLQWGKMLAGRRGPGDAEMGRALLAKAHTVAGANGYANVELRRPSKCSTVDDRGASLRAPMWHPWQKHAQVGRLVPHGQRR
jgi:hypothetical protein